jgi:hypothetical protein
MWSLHSSLIWGPFEDCVIWDYDDILSLTAEYLADGSGPSIVGNRRIVSGNWNLGFYKVVMLTVDSDMYQCAGYNVV